MNDLAEPAGEPGAAETDSLNTCARGAALRAVWIEWSIIALCWPTMDHLKEPMKTGEV